MKKCYVCNRKSNFKHLDRFICKKCFLRNIEKRVKKHLGRRLFKKNDKILVVGELEEFLLKRAIKGMPLKIILKKKLPKKTTGFNWVVIGKTMDEIDEEFLEGLFAGKLVLGKIKKKFFNILEVLTDEEVKQYAKLKGIKLKVKKGKRFLDGLKEFKELKYNLYKNIKGLRNFNF